MNRDSFTHKEFELYKVAARNWKETSPSSYRLPAVTICRQAGARGELTAHALKQYLDALNVNPLPWMVFEANLVDLIMEQELLPPGALHNMPEDKVGFWSRMRARFAGIPTDRDLFCRTSSVISEILNLGHSIVVGRGASYCAADMPHVLKVKLMASKETAIRRIAYDDKISRKEANLVRQKRNSARDAYIRAYFRKNPADLDPYDLTIQTDNLRIVEVAELIAKALLDKIGRPDSVSIVA